MRISGRPSMNFCPSVRSSAGAGSGRVTIPSSIIQSISSAMLSLQKHYSSRKRMKRIQSEGGSASCLPFLLANDKGISAGKI